MVNSNKVEKYLACIKPIDINGSVDDFITLIGKMVKEFTDQGYSDFTFYTNTYDIEYTNDIYYEIGLYGFREKTKDELEKEAEKRKKLDAINKKRQETNKRKNKERKLREEKAERELYEKLKAKYGK